MQKSFGLFILIGSILHVTMTWKRVKGEGDGTRFWPSSTSETTPVESHGLTVTDNFMQKSRNYQSCHLTWKEDKQDFESALTVLANGTFRLKCPAVGRPKPSIKWFKDGREIQPYLDDKIQLKGYALEVKQASTPFAEGQYKCVVENECGTLQDSFDVVVIVRYTKRPVFGESPKNETVAVGSNVTLICRVLSDAPVYYDWYKVLERTEGNSDDDEQFERLENGGNIFFNETHLIIVNASISDSGHYMCYAANQFGANNRTAWISILPEEITEKANIHPAVVLIVAVLVGCGVTGVVVSLCCCLCFSQRLQNNFDGIHGTSLAKQWEIAGENLKLFEAVGEGEFGIVYRGQITGTPDICGYLNQAIVAVKMLKVGATVKEVQDIVDEMNTMKDLGYHPNVIQFIGCCTINGPFAVVMEYAAYGSLKSLLCKFKISASTFFVMPGTEEQQLLLKNPLIDNLQLWTFSTQVAKGLEYLASKKIVHRDVAARNVLVTEDFVAKIADFGLTRNVTSSLAEQYIPGRHRCLPIKWMSPESLETKVFTTKSDVWSFGILLWEIFTYASNPYPTVHIQSLIPLLKTGYRMEKPLEASDEMYLIMRSCWQLNPEDRPSFEELVKQLEASGEQRDNVISRQSW